MTSSPLRLGFGCASLGSRISARNGLRALNRAHCAGIQWFDVAPSYGDGLAESLLGRFLATSPAHVTICTKVGIAPPRPSPLQRLARPLLRPLVASFPHWRDTVRKHRPAAIRRPLTAEHIRHSVDASLSRLAVKCLDVLALHDASPQEVVREDILRTLEDLRQAGKIRRVAIASDVPAIQAGLRASSLYEIVQLTHNPIEPGLEAIADSLASAHPMLTIGHSVLAPLRHTAKCIEQTPSLAQAFANAGYAGTAATIAADFLLDYAIATNPDGITLLSMFEQRHLEHNLARARSPRTAPAMRQLATLLNTSSPPGGAPC